MFLMQNFMGGIASLLDVITSAYMLIVFLSLMLRWAKASQHHQLVRLANSLTEIPCTVLRNKLRFLVIRGVDVTGPVLLLSLLVFRGCIVQMLYSLSR